MFTPRLNSHRRSFACEAPPIIINSVQCGTSRHGKLMALRLSNELRFGTVRIAVLAATLCLLALTACSYPDERSLNIPEGLASHTLKEFAKQADVEIIFNPPSVSEVRTNPVVGKMSPRAALELMLSGTALVFERDPETGAYAVTSNQIPDTAVKAGD